VIYVGAGEPCEGFTPPPYRMCDKGLFCERKAGQCGLADVPGTCVVISQVCPANYAPVCSCDGKEYGNDCARRAAGAQLAYTGPCKKSEGTLKAGERCGTTAATCAAGLVCDPDAGSCESAGTCKAIPGACTKEYVPVCGCNGVTYGNDCARLSSGVAKARDGECKGEQRLLPTGTWGGRGIRMTVKDATVGATVEFDCASGTVTGPFTLWAAGEFKLRGTYAPGFGGARPIIAPPPAPLGATYAGSVSGNTMVLDLWVDGQVKPLSFKLQLGGEARLNLCL
jgi:hypothetical protein